MENEIKNELPAEVVADEATRSPETVETPAPNSEPEVDILSILGEPTERKPEHWEQQETVNEHLDGFDPPPPPEQERDYESPALIDPDKTLRKVPKSVVSAGSKMLAPVFIELIDTVVPTVCGKIAKTADSERFCAKPDAKKTMTEALDAWMGEANVELSPMWVFFAAVVAAYAPAAIDVYELRKAHEKIERQHQEIEEISAEQRETKKQLVEAEMREQETLKKLNEIKLENSELVKKSAEAELKAKQISAKPVKPKKETKAAAKTARKNAAN